MSYALGAYPLGGFDPAISGSVGDPLVGLLTDPTAKREFLLRATPKNTYVGLTFAGSTSSKVVAANAVSPSGAMTMEAWIYPTALPATTNAAAANWVNGAANLRQLGTEYSTGRLAFFVRNDAGTLYYVGPGQAAADLRLNWWTHVAGVIDVSALRLRGFVNGVELSSATVLAGTFANTMTSCTIGGSADGQFFAGRIAMVRVWNVARTAAEIAASMNYHCVGMPGLVYEWALDEQSGTVAREAMNPPLMNGSLASCTWSNAAPIPTIYSSVDLSSGGYASASTDSPYKLFPGCIRQPYSFSVSLPTPDLSGGAQASVGDTYINNADSLHDREALLDWLGATSDVYIGRPTDPLTGFTRIQRGVATQTQWSADEWAIIHRDTRFRLQRPLLTGRYGGFNRCVRGDGNDDTVTATMQAPGGTMTMEFRAKQLSTPPLDLKGLAGWHASGIGDRLVGWSNAHQGRLMFLLRDDVPNLWLYESTQTLTVGRWYHIALVIDYDAGRTPKTYIRGYIDGALAFPVQQLSSAFSTPNSTLKLLHGGTGYSNMDCDEFRIWNVARTQAQIQAAMGSTLLGTETGLVYYNKFEDGSGGTATRTVGNAPYNVDLTLTGATWVASLEGDASVAGQPKPVALGKRHMVKPVLVDPYGVVYQVHDGSVNAITNVCANGAPYTLDTSAPGGTGDVTDIYVYTPTQGKYITCKAQGLLRLYAASDAKYEITCDVEGDNGGSLGYLATASGILRKLAYQWGGLTTADVDGAAAILLSTAQPATLGFYWYQDIDIADAMDEVARSVRAWWSPNRVGIITMGRIEPPSSLSPTISISTADLVDPQHGGSFSRTPLGIRVGRVVVAYRRYQTTLDDDRIAASITDLAVRYDLTQEWRYVQAVDPDRVSDYDTLVIESSFDLAADAQAEANRMLELWKTDRAIWTVTLDSGVLSYFIGSVFSAALGRYDVVTAQTMVCVGLDENMGENGQVESLAVNLLR